MSWKKFMSAIACMSPCILFGSTPTTDITLNTAIINANAGIDTTINFGNSIVLTGAFPGLNLRPVNITDTFSPAGMTITINGGNFTLSGGRRGFFIRGGGGSVAINNLAFNGLLGLGGNGGAVDQAGGGGGGGAGLGGALFIGSGATVTLTNPSFTNCTANGGVGGVAFGGVGSSGGSGGGGFRGNGGNYSFGTILSGSGGGGVNESTAPLVSAQGGSGGSAATAGLASGSSDGGTGGSSFAGVGGAAGGVAPGGSGASGGVGTGAGGGGGAVGTGPGGVGGNGDLTPANPGGAGGGGGAAGASPTLAGGNGGIGADFAGGGGGGASINGSPGATTGPAGNGGAGGFAGGGGGGGPSADTALAGNGAIGGFGGGGGGGGALLDVGGTNTGSPGSGASGGFGGGTGGPGVMGVLGGGGGGGAGFGGALFLQDGATVTIAGSATFAGNTAVEGVAGGLTATAGIAAGNDIFMMSGSSLTFNITSNVTMPYPIEGDIGAGGGDQTAGGLIKSGPGRLTLTGDNTYTGMTRVSAGELRANSTIITETIVEAGAIISGNFIIMAAGANPLSGNLTNAGTVSPGVNGAGIITIDRDYTQTGTGTFLVDITPDGISDRLFLTAGNAMLDGTLNIIVNQGNYIAGTQYEIINAPTNGTQFATVVQSGPLAGLMGIQVDYSSVVLTILDSLIFVDIFIEPGIPSAVKECFTSVPITPGSDFATVTELLGILDQTAVNSALVSLSPVQFGALEWINERNNSYVADLLSQHLFELCCSPRDYCCCDSDSSVWINVFGNIMDNRKRLDNLNPFDANAVGALAGIDFSCGADFYFGASIGYTHTHLIWRNQEGKGNLDSYYGALYASWQCNCFSVDISGIGGATDQDLERHIVFKNLDRVAKSDPWAYFATGHLGLRFMWDCSCTTFEPFAVGDYNYYHRESFKEKGADSINLNVRSKDQHFIRGEGGLRVYSNTMSTCYCVAPYIGLSWVGEFPLNKSKQKATFINQDCLIDVESYDSSVQLASPQGGVKWTCCDGASLTLGYKGLFNRETRINQVEGRFEWVF